MLFFALSIVFISSGVISQDTLCTDDLSEFFVTTRACCVSLPMAGYDPEVDPDKIYYFVGDEGRLVVHDHAVNGFNLVGYVDGMYPSWGAQNHVTLNGKMYGVTKIADYQAQFFSYDFVVNNLEVNDIQVMHGNNGLCVCSDGSYHIFLIGQTEIRAWDIRSESFVATMLLQGDFAQNSACAYSINQDTLFSFGGWSSSQGSTDTIRKLPDPLGELKEWTTLDARTTANMMRHWALLNRDDQTGAELIWLIGGTQSYRTIELFDPATESLTLLGTDVLPGHHPSEFSPIFHQPFADNEWRLWLYGTGYISASNQTWKLAPCPTESPTRAPTVMTAVPSRSPTTVSPTTSSPSNMPTISTRAPTTMTDGPSKSPTTSEPTLSPTTFSPSQMPTVSTHEPTVMTDGPSKSPTTSSPTSVCDHLQSMYPDCSRELCRSSDESTTCVARPELGVDIVDPLNCLANGHSNECNLFGCGQCGNSNDCLSLCRKFNDIHLTEIRCNRVCNEFRGFMCFSDCFFRNDCFQI